MVTDDVPLWEQRYRATDVTFPSWARHAPDRVVFASSESGAYQVVAEDLGTGLRRQVTHLAVGTMHGGVSTDGAWVVWFDDRTGDEVGQWVREPFAGGGDPEPLVAGVPDAWSAGLALGDEVTVVGVAGDFGYRVYVAGADGGPARLLHEHPEWVELVGLDRNGALLAFDHAEHGDVMRPALRVIDVATGATVGEQWDGEGHGVFGGSWSPVAGDRRLAFTADRSGRARPGVWDLTSGERRDLALPSLPGDVTACGWWPDASALLVQHTVDGRDELWRLDLATDDLARIDTPAGTVTGARVRPDGSVWLRVTSGARAPEVVVAGSGAEVVAPRGPRAPAAYDYESWEFRNGDGARVHGFLVCPPGREAPYPTVMLIHGGPAWLWADAWRPEVGAWVDHGFAVAMVNYRGSTGYGPAWRDALIGSPGFTELADLMAGLDDLVGRGVTDPKHVVVSGGSWGGYLSLLALGRHPDRWAAGIAIVPVADYVAAYEDEAPGLQALDKLIFGGGSDEMRALYEERSPITYVDDVTAPVLVITGANDTRCPRRQVDNYVARLEAAGKDHVYDVFDAGHGSMVLTEKVRHMRLELDFLGARGLLPG